MDERVKVPSNEMRGWTPELRSLVQDLQERKYRRIADALGLGSDPGAAYAKLSNMRLLDDEQPDRWRQRGYYADVPDDQWARYMQSLNATVKPYYEVELPTRYEHPDWYPAMMLIFDTVHGAMARHGQGISPPPLIATQPSGDINAIAVKVPRSSRRVVFFEHSLFQFIDDFAWLTAWAVPPISPAQMMNDRALAGLPTRYNAPYQASELFTGVLFSYAIHGSAAGNVDRDVLPRPYQNNQLASGLVSGMEYFLMSHELSHLKLDHWDKNPASDRQQWNWELEADLEGAGLAGSIMNQHLGPEANAIGFWACYLALTALDLLYRTLGLFTYGTENLNWVSKTHPYPLTRRAHIRSVFQNARDISKASVAAADRLCAISDTAFQTFWELMLASCYPRYQQGARSSPLWNATVRNMSPKGT